MGNYINLIMAEAFYIDGPQQDENQPAVLPSQFPPVDPPPPPSLVVPPGDGA